MTHPEELLAGYVDGTLTEDERTVVDTHLKSCETCRGEVVLATGAVAALAELRDEPVPFGVTGPAIADFERRAARARTPWWRARVHWVAGLAAAAAAIALLAVALPHVGREAGDERAGQGRLAAQPTTIAEGGAPGEFAAPVPLEVQDVDYGDAVKLQALAEETAALRGQDLSAPVPSPTTSNKAATAETAMSCVAEAAGDGLTANDTLVRLIQAKFGGKPAYLGVYLESPGPDEAPDQVVIWVASKRACSLLSFSSKAI
ncbi:MAG: zf-HC2 domain-containing protein [Actinomycetota bacterium]